MKRRYLPTIIVSAVAIVALVATVSSVVKECPRDTERNGLLCISTTQGGSTSETETSDTETTDIGTVETEQSSTAIISPETEVDLANEARFSAGEKNLFTDQSNPDTQAGAEAIESGDYQRAISRFESAVASSRSEPEPQIYLNNAIARQQGNPYRIAVVVPISNRSAAARDILRGVADAQTQFNEAEKTGDRLIEVVIVNDGNDPDIAAAVASKIAATSDIVGVVGHNSSGASQKALPEYEKVGLPMISPTSTSTELSGGVFFRTVPSDRETGQRLAEYAADTLGHDNVAIVFDSDSAYSRSLREAFSTSFSGNIANEIDLFSEELSFSEAVENIDSTVSAVLLFPSTGTVSRAIGIANANFAQSPSDRFQLLGGDSLYESKTLTEGGVAIEGMVLAVPWFANTPYAARANGRWGGRVNWRTASSYDATKAIASTLSGDSTTRSSVLRGVSNAELEASDTSGLPLEFERLGDRAGEPLLVKATQGGNTPDGSKFGFELIE